MAKGQRTKAGHIIQMIYHGADPNRFNPNGKRVVAHNAEDYDYIDGIEFDKLGRKGAKALIANVPLEEMWTGKISGPLHYNLMDDQIFPFWIAKGVETPITVDGVPCIDTEYVRPQLDRAERAFFAIEEGKSGGGADLGCYGMFTSFKWTSKRGNKGKSRFEVGFVTQAAVRRQSLTGGTAQNHKFRITAANVAGPVGLSIVVPGVAQAKAVLLAIGDSVAAIAGKFTAEGLTATVTGGVATSSGKSQQITYSGAGPLTIGSGGGAITVDLSTPETPSAFLNRFNTANPTRQVTLGAGASIAKAVGNGLPRVAGAGNASYNGDYALTGYDTNGNPYYTNPNGRVLGYKFFSAGNSSNFWGLDTSIDAIVGAEGEGSPAYGKTTTNNAVFPRAIYTTRSQGTAPDATVSEQTASASANLTLLDPASAGNPADFAVSAGAVSTVTPPGSAGGIVDITFTDPGNTAIAVNKTTGDANYVLTTTQYGGDGSILQAMKADDPIMPGHLFLYSADTPVGLEDEANLIGQIGEWEIDDPKICMPVSHHVRINDPERPNLPATYNAHAEEESQEDGIKLSVTMDADDDGAVIATMQSLLRASGSRLVSVPRYWRIAAIHPGSLQRVFLDFYGSVGAAVPVKWGGSVEQYTFVYDLLENKTAPWNFKAKTRRFA